MLQSARAELAPGLKNPNGTQEKPPNQTTARESNDENKPTTARVTEQNAYQLTGKRKLESRQMKFKLQLREAKEQRKVGSANK